MGVGVVAGGVVDDDRQALAAAPAIPADLPVVAQAKVVPAPAPAKPTPKPTRTPVSDPGLGPPPGPYPDKVPTRFAAPADRYAFLVGMQDYRSPTHDTIASVADVLLIRDSLLAAGWQPENIKVITDAQVTGNAIRAGMDWLAATSVAGKTFSLFHYSGHVKQFGGQREGLWPVDRDWVRDTEVTARLSRITGKAWVDIAGCEAASFMAGLPSARVLFTSSSKATQKSYEQPAWRASVWTGLVFGIAPHRADADKDGTVVIGEALRYSQYYAQKVTLKQRPHGRQTPQLAGDDVRGWTLSNPPA
jgi:hypothetical protein